MIRIKDSGEGQGRVRVRIRVAAGVKDMSEDERDGVLASETSSRPYCKDKNESRCKTRGGRENIG